MSKRHQSSRRKTYGRRQHEVRERHDRGQHAEGFELELGEWGPAAQADPLGVPRSAEPAPPPRARRLTDGRLRGRPPAHDRAPAPPARRGGPDAAAPARPRSVSAPAAGRTASASSSAPSSSRSCSPSSRSRSRSASSATGYDIGRLDARAPATRGHRGQDLRSDLNRLGREPAIRKQAHRRRPRPARPTRSSCRRARRSTDRCWAGPIRAAASSSCCCVFVVGSLALTARLAYWQVVDRERLAAEALAQTTIRLETPSQRGDVYDRSGHGRPGHDRRARPTRRRARPADAGPSACDGRRARPDPRPRRRGRRRPPGPAREQRQVPHPALRARARGRRPDPQRDRREARVRAVARAGAGARLPAGRRRAGLDPRGAPARLRQPRGHRPVRRRAGLPGDARRASPGWSSPSATRPASRSSTRPRSSQTGVPGTGPPPDDRRRPPAARSSRSSSPPGSPTAPSVRPRS